MISRSITALRQLSIVITTVAGLTREAGMPRHGLEETTVPDSHVILPTLIPFTGRDYISEPTTPVSINTASSLGNTLDAEDFYYSYFGIVDNHQRIIEQSIAGLVKKRTKQDKRQINEFRLLKSLGRGQFGKVYLAQDQSHRTVAIKCIPKKPRNPSYSMSHIMKQMKRWRQKGYVINSGESAVIEMNVNKIRWEVYVLGKLSHGNISTIMQCIDSPQSKEIFIVSSFANLGELKWFRNEQNMVLEQWTRFMGGKVTVQEFAEKIFKDITNGLLYLSSKGVVHRDIKPSNVLLDSSTGQAKISDFGCSLLSPPFLEFQNALLEEAYSRELNKIVGTPAFIPPELCDFGSSNRTHSKDSGFKIDIWALGITMFCLLENRLPFWGETEFETYKKIVNEELTLNGDWIHDIVVSRLLVKDTAQRTNIKSLHALLFGKIKSKGKGVKNLVSKLRSIGTKFKPKKEEPKPCERIYVDVADTASLYSGDTSSSLGSVFEIPVQIADVIKTPAHNEDPDDRCRTPLALQPSPERDISMSLPTQTQTHSVTSLSPIKLDTPIKDFVIMEDIQKYKGPMPVADDRSLPSREDVNKPPWHIISSHGTTNFQKYLHSPPKAEKGSTPPEQQETVDDLRRYLVYADGQ